MPRAAPDEMLMIAQDQRSTQLATSTLSAADNALAQGVDTLQSAREALGAALKSLGRTGLAEIIERNCRCARRFADGLQAAGYEVLNDVVLNQVMVSFGDPETTKAVIEGIQKDGTCWAGPTLWQGRTAMRISVSCWATTEVDVDRSLEAMLRVAEGVQAVTKIA